MTTPTKEAQYSQETQETIILELANIMRENLFDLTYEIGKTAKKSKIATVIVWSQSCEPDAALFVQRIDDCIIALSFCGSIFYGQPNPKAKPPMYPQIVNASMAEFFLAKQTHEKFVSIDDGINDRYIKTIDALIELVMSLVNLAKKVGISQEEINEWDTIATATCRYLCRYRIEHP